MLLDLAARVTTSGLMPDGSQGVQGAVCVMSAEDGLEDTIHPRLTRAGADLSRVVYLDSVAGKPLVIPYDLDVIEERLRQFDARLLIIDPLVAFLAQARSDQEIRQCLHPVKEVAERCRCTVLYLRHLNKSSGMKAIYRGSGFISITGAARVSAVVAPHPDDEGLKVVAHVKYNLSDRQQSLTFRLEPDAAGVCKLAWGDRSDLTCDDLLRERRDDQGEGERRTALTEACSFLNEVLRDGPQSISRHKREARVLGISERTLERAARELQLQRLYPAQLGLRRSPSSYCWGLPGSLPIAPPNDAEEGHATTNADTE